MHLKDLSRVSLRECEDKAASLTQTGAFYPDLATHRLRQRLGNRQTDAGASKGARTRLVDTIEAFKDVGELLLGKADAGIADAEGNPIFLAAHSHFDPTWRRRIAQCIDQDVREDLYSTGR